MKQCKHEEFFNELFDFCYDRREDFSPQQCVFSLLYVALEIAIKTQVNGDIERAIFAVDESYKTAREIVVKNIELDETNG